MKKNIYIHPITQLQEFYCLKRVMEGTGGAGKDDGNNQFGGAPARTIYV